MTTATPGHHFQAGVGGADVRLGMRPDEVGAAWAGQPMSLHVYPDEASVHARIPGVTAFVGPTANGWAVAAIEVSVGHGATVSDVALDELTEAAAAALPGVARGHVEPGGLSTWRGEGVTYCFEAGAVVGAMLMAPTTGDVIDGDPAGLAAAVAALLGARAAATLD